MARTHNVDELVRRLEEYGEVELERGANLSARILWKWRDDHPGLVLITSEFKLTDCLRKLGSTGVDIWPTVPEKESAFRLLEIHLEEIRDAISDPERPFMIDAKGLHR